MAGEGEWQTEYRPSWLALKQQEPAKAVVVRIAPDAILGPGKARLYEGWANGRKVYDPTTEFRIGQVVRLD